MEDEKEIIYIALSNSISFYTNLLETNDNLPEADELMARHILSRSEELLDKYAFLIGGEEKPMGKPKWD